MGFRDLIPVQQDFYKTLGIITLQKASNDRRARQLANQAFAENFRRREADRSRKAAEKTERQQVNTMIGGTILATVLAGVAGGSTVLGNAGLVAEGGTAAGGGSAATAITAAEAAAAVGTPTGLATGSAGSGLGATVAGATGTAAAGTGGLFSGIGSALNKGGRTVLGAAEDQTLSGRALELLPQALAQMTDARAGTNLGGFVQSYQDRPRQLAEVRSRNNREQIGLELAQNRDARAAAEVTSDAATQVRRAAIAESIAPGDADFAERYGESPAATMSGVIKQDIDKKKAESFKAIKKDHRDNNVESNILRLDDPAAADAMDVSFTVIETMDVTPETKKSLHLEQRLSEGAKASERYGTVDEKNQIVTRAGSEKYVEDAIALITPEEIMEMGDRGELKVLVAHLNATAPKLTKEEIEDLLLGKMIDMDSWPWKTLEVGGEFLYDTIPAAAKGVPGAIAGIPAAMSGMPPRRGDSSGAFWGDVSPQDTRFQLDSDTGGYPYPNPQRQPRRKHALGDLFWGTPAVGDLPVARRR